jgi:hypothetical protein
MGTGTFNLLGGIPCRIFKGLLGFTTEQPYHSYWERCDKGPV